MVGSSHEKARFLGGAGHDAPNGGELPRETRPLSRAGVCVVVPVSVADVVMRGAGVVTLLDPQTGLPAAVNCSGRMANATGQSQDADPFV